MHPEPQAKTRPAGAPAQAWRVSVLLQALTAELSESEGTSMPLMAAGDSTVEVVQP